MAFTSVHSGKTIEYPKTWLSNTLYHKHNDRLRNKYCSPVTVCLEEGLSVSDEEAAKVRKELNHFSYITWEVLIRFYYGNQSVAAIAKDLGISGGTVESQLYAARSQMQKGFETMESRENYLLGSFGCEEGIKNELISLVEGNLISFLCPP